MIIKKNVKFFVPATIAAFLAVSCLTTGKIEDSNPESPSQSERPAEQKPAEPKVTFDKKSFLMEVKDTVLGSGAEKALGLYSKVPEKFAGDFDILLMKARLLNVCGDYTGAKVIVDQLLGKKSGNADLLKLQYSVEKNLFMDGLSKKMENGTTEQTLGMYSDLPSILEDDFDLKLVKASLLIGVNRLTAAEVECDKLDIIRKDAPEILVLRKEIAARRGDVKAKNEQLQKILRKDPYNAEANIDLAYTATIKKQYPQARQYYQKVLSKEPKNPDALFGMGQVSYYMENDADSKKYFESLLEVDPKNDGAYAFLGKLAFAEDKHKIALQNVEKAIELNDRNYDYWNDYGTYLRYNGRFDDAIQAWTRAIEIQPDYFLTYGYRAGIYDETEQYDKALADYEKVVELNPKYYFAYESIGVLSLHKKDYVRAGQAFMKCAAAVNANGVNNIYYPIMITYCYWKLGNKYEAQKYSDKVLRKIGKVDSIEYKMLRMFHDGKVYRNNPLPQQVGAVDSMTQRARWYFYLGLFNDMIAGPSAGKDYYAKVLNINSPMFFEYRLAEWAMQEMPPEEE